MVYQEVVGNGGVGGGNKIRICGLSNGEDFGYFAFKVADFAGYRPHRLRLVCGEVMEGLGSLSMLNLGAERD